MSSARTLLRAVALCLSVLALLAWGAGLAQADPPSWMINGAKVTSSLLPALQIKEVESFTLLSTISSIKVEISCTGGSLTGVKLETQGLLSSGGTARLTGCTSKLNGIKQLSCEPHNGLEKGVIVTEGLKGALSKHSTEWIMSLEPKTGETLATIATGEECLVGEKIPLIGKLTLKDPAWTTKSVTHLVQEGPLSELWLTSKTEEHKATMGGGIVLELGGEHKGKTWNALLLDETTQWRVNKANVSSTLLPGLVGSVENKTASLSFTTGGGTKIEYLCTSAEPTSGGQLKLGGAISEGRVRFQGCVTLLNGTVSKACQPRTEGIAGIIETEKLKALLVFHEGTGVVRVEPASGTVLVTLSFGETCSIGEVESITGVASFQDTTATAEQVSHLWTQGPLTSITARSQPAAISAAVSVSLTGAHKALNWSGQSE